MFNKTNNIHIT